MRNEQIMMTIILWIIALVAAFSVMNTTITVTMQKRREIGVLNALGCRTGDIVRIFVVKAAVIGGVGVVLGVVASLLVLWLRNDIREWIAELTASQVHAIEGVFLSEIPARVTMVDVALAAGGSLVLCLVAAFIPAWVAARLEPAVALRDG
jgi:lipoprotein-releasing system permease protein